MRAGGKPTKVTDARGKSYTPNNDVETSQNAIGGTTTNTFGANSGPNGGESLTKTESPTGSTGTATYTGGGGCQGTGGSQYQAKCSTNGSGHKKSFTYDGPGNRTDTGDDTAAKASLSYNPDGTVATSTDPANQSLGAAGKTNYYYTDRQLTLIVPPASSGLGQRSFAYDGYGRLVTSTAGNGVVTTYAYDAVDRPTSVSFAGGPGGVVQTPAVLTAYNDTTRVTTRTQGTQVTTSRYDSLNKLVLSSITPTGTTPPASCPSSPSPGVQCQGYDLGGRVTSVTDTRGVTAYHYDLLALVDQVTLGTGQRVLFDYDDDGNRTDTWLGASGATSGGPGGPTYGTGANANVVVGPGGFAAHTHVVLDSGGRATRVTTTRANSDDPSVRVADESTCFQAFNPAGPNTQACPGGKTTDRSQRQWTRDEITGVPTVYSYDGGGRLSKAEDRGVRTWTYTYDASGNRTSYRFDAGGTGPTTYYAYNPGNQQCGTTGSLQSTPAACPAGSQQAYDLNGNQTAAPLSGLPGLSYSNTDQTTSITSTYSTSPTPTAVPFAYEDATQSERRTAGTTTFSNGAQNTYQQSGGTAGTLQTTTAPDGTLLSLQTAGLTYWYALDTRGSVRALVPSTGAVPEATYGYDPYGVTTPAGPNTTLAQNNPYRYLGSYQDTQGTDHGTNLYKLGLRYYDPTQGRFTQQDSVDQLGDLQDGNRYGYAGSNPVNSSDPTGADTTNGCSRPGATRDYSASGGYYGQCYGGERTVKYTAVDACLTGFVRGAVGRALGAAFVNIVPGFGQAAYGAFIVRSAVTGCALKLFNYYDWP